MTSNTSTTLSFSSQFNLETLPDLKAPITVSCCPGLDPKNIGPFSKKDISLNPLSKFLLTYRIKLEKILLLKTFKSELIGFIISISFFLSTNNSLIFESVNDHVTVSK